MIFFASVSLLSACLLVSVPRLTCVVPSAMFCAECKQPILVSDLPLECVGLNCSSVYHYKCSGLTRPTAKTITENVNVCFKCNECLSNQCCGGKHLALDVGRIEEEMKQLVSFSSSVTAMRDQIKAQIDNALKLGMEQLRCDVKGSLDKLLCEKFESLNKVLELNAQQNLAVMNDARARTVTIHSESDQVGKKRRIDTLNPDENDDVFDDNATFAEVVKRRGKNKKSSISNSNTNEISKSNNNGFKPVKRKTRPVIVIKPKESKQACEETRKFLKTKLDPKTHKVSNFRNGKDGSIIVECALGENIDKLKNGIESNLGENYSAVVPTAVPRLKVVGMSENFPPDVFIDYLKSQNDCIEIKDVKVVNMYENPRFTYNKYSAVIEVDLDTYNCLLSAKQVNIEFDRCSVIPAINVLRCFKCGEFGHKSVDCKNCDTCSRCSQKHKTSECTSTVLKCVNCLKTNKERKMNLDVNHAAFSSECLIYKRLFDQKKSSLRFNK